MAMNKKEQESLRVAQREAAVGRALSWSKYAPAPLDTPESGAIEGWNATFWSSLPCAARAAAQAITSKYFHGHGVAGRLDSQGSLTLYPSKVEALKAARIKAERVFAEFLADVDKAIEKEQS